MLHALFGLIKLCLGRKSGSTVYYTNLKSALGIRSFIQMCENVNFWLSLRAFFLYLIQILYTRRESL